MLTRDQIVEIRAALTVGDSMAARSATKDDVELGMRAFYRRAQKLHLINGESFEDFVDLIRVEDMKVLTEADVTGPLANVPEPSLDSAASGE